MIKIAAGSLLLALALMAPARLAVADPAGISFVDRLLASQCAQCHGTDGMAVGDIDKLAGEDVGEKVVEMKRKRKANIMHRQALGYTDEQIRLLADYFSDLSEEREHDHD